MFYGEMSLGMRGRGVVCRHCRFWSSDSRCFGQKAKIVIHKANTKGYIQKGKCHVSTL